jgi:amino acid transporter
MAATVDSKSEDPSRRDLSQILHRRLIGLLGITLPVLLYLVSGILPTEGLDRWAFLSSVSAYYYTSAGGILVGILFALSLFLFSYPGYEDAIADRVVGGLGGAAALGVALFPTKAPGDLPEPSWWRPEFDVVHHVSAVLLFVAFTLFSAWLFRKSKVSEKKQRPADKQWRDAVCGFCGIAMVFFVLWAASSWFTRADIFWPETLAIVAFATSWLAKGEVHRLAVAAVRALAG